MQPHCSELFRVLVFHETPAPINVKMWTYVWNPADDSRDGTTSMKVDGVLFEQDSEGVFRGPGTNSDAELLAMIKVAHAGYDLFVPADNSLYWQHWFGK